ncbi:MAG: type IV pilus twitching motility protein PilT [Planctomycetes bacterium]|nr:type IV pilus twitching motility protein PilT [Planctomycetota bacterium]
MLDELLREMIATTSSDLHLKVGRPPLMRRQGELKPTEHPPLTEEQVREMLFSMMSERQQQRFERDWEIDLAYHLPGEARFRVNGYFQRGHVNAALRLIPEQVPTIDELELPEVMKELALRKQGLILVTGPTGSGKSTSQSAMVEHINQNQDRHIVTIEDPVEYVFTDKRATIDQREVGTDTRSHKEALRRVLRQDPDIILMGEMRDPETIEIGLHAAETGHLVFSTLHTNDAKQTVDRILDTIGSDMLTQYRSMLSLNLMAVLSQRLLPRADGSGRIAAMEVMINSPHVAELIREGKTIELQNAIATSKSYYQMQTFNQALSRLVQEGLITAEVALEFSDAPGDLRLMLRGVGTGAAAATTKEETEPEQDKPKTSIVRGFEF